MEWFLGHDHQVATCPITQGTLLRFLLREGVETSSALAILHKILSLPEHVFWPDEIGYDASALAGVIGHRQVTTATLPRWQRTSGESWRPWTGVWPRFTRTRRF